MGFGAMLASLETASGVSPMKKVHRATASYVLSGSNYVRFGNTEFSSRSGDPVKKKTIVRDANLAERGIDGCGPGLRDSRTGS